MLEAQEVAANSGGALRVRFEQGWASMQSSSGVQILERCDPAGQSLTPTPGGGGEHGGGERGTASAGRPPQGSTMLLPHGMPPLPTPRGTGGVGVARSVAKSSAASLPTDGGSEERPSMLGALMGRHGTDTFVAKLFK